MKTIDENLSSAMEQGNETSKLPVIVTTGGSQPEGFGLTSFEGLDGLYHGQLTEAQIKELSQHPDVKAVELDGENTVLGN